MTARRLFAAAAIFLAFERPCDAGGPPSGFDYCAPPLRPACIEATRSTDDCEAEVQSFIKTVFLYRACLERESERAVREANSALEAWKCQTGALKCR